METEIHTNSESSRSRNRSPRRLRHEAQAKVFENQAGNLEKIRLQLGLRPSQICEILKVHPSAWTRWTRYGSTSAPPHIYQMLDWYLELLKWRGQHQIKKDENPQILQVQVEKPSRLPQLLLIVWSIQTILWCIVITLLVKHK